MARDCTVNAAYEVKFYGGSSPSLSAKLCGSSIVVSASLCQSEYRGFKSLLPHYFLQLLKQNQIYCYIIKVVIFYFDRKVFYGFS